MTSRTSLALAGALALCGASGSALALDGITDRPSDFLPTFAGSTSSADLDVIAATVTYDPGADLFRLSGTFSGAVGSTPGGFYVWGVNRGAGTTGFASNGIDGVRFDRVILLRPDGTGTIPGVGDLAAGAVTVSGNTLSGVVPGSMLVSTGFGKIDYTWNLWPRDGTFSGFAAISDFAPDNANFTASIGAVPEPATAALLLVGAALIAGLRRRRD